jgi:hypothetical protein
MLTGGANYADRRLHTLTGAGQANKMVRRLGIADDTAQIRSNVMKVRFLLSAFICLCLVSTVWTFPAVPDKQPPKDKDSEVKELLAEHKALRQRLEEVEKRLGSNLPVWVQMSHPFQYLKGNSGGVFSDGGIRRDKIAFINLVLSTDQKRWKPVSARQVFKDQFFNFEVEIPHQDAKQAPIRVIGSAKAADDDSSEMQASFSVPKEARLGHVEIKLTWGESHRLVQGRSNPRIYIVQAK